MDKSKLDSYRQILKLLREVEHTLAALYDAFAQRSTADVSFWKGIAEQERGHAAKILTMQALLEEKPEQFSIGRMFTAAAVQTYLHGLRDNLEKARKGDLPRERFVPLAQSFETSLLENRFFEIFTSKDLEFNALRKEILDETQSHQRALRNKKP